jgi:RHS repeat-associated protein
MRVEGGPVAEENGVFYLLRDHLGSASVTVKEGSGALTKYAELRYKPWGEDRPASDAFNETLSPSERRFTGQRAHDELDLYYYQARWYDPALGRFVQPDSIVRGSQGVQAWDRYAYANNSPVRYTDPTGHWLDEGCRQLGCGLSLNEQIAEKYDPYYDYLGFDDQSLWRSIVAGAPCTGCHLTFRSGRIPSNRELSLTQISIWKALDKFTVSIHLGGLGSVTTMAQQAINVSDPMNYIPAADAEDVSGAFADMQVGYANEDITAYRYISPSSNPAGHWLSPNPSLTPDQARATLALPNGNTATQVTQFVIPKGTNYIYGSVAGQTGTLWAGSYAVGGGPQIYILDFSVLFGGN